MAPSVLEELTNPNANPVFVRSRSRTRSSAAGETDDLNSLDEDADTNSEDLDQVDGIQLELDPDSETPDESLTNIEYNQGAFSIPPPPGLTSFPLFPFERSYSPIIQYAPILCALIF